MIPEVATSKNKDWYSLVQIAQRRKENLKKDLEKRSWSIGNWIEERDSPIIYLMWDAWTGKSTLVNYIVSEIFESDAECIAPTNMAAENIWWKTFYKSFGRTPDVSIHDIWETPKDIWDEWKYQLFPMLWFGSYQETINKKS